MSYYDTNENLDRIDRENDDHRFLPILPVAPRFRTQMFHVHTKAQQENDSTYCGETDTCASCR